VNARGRGRSVSINANRVVLYAGAAATALMPLFLPWSSTRSAVSIDVGGGVTIHREAEEE